MDIKVMTKTALITAVICVIAPLSISIGSVPISFTNLILYLGIYLLDTKHITISYIIYLLLGSAGLPVFSGFQGGIGKLVGPTGGYLVGFVFMIIISGVFVKKFSSNKILQLAGMIIGTFIAYIFGTMWFVFVNNTGIAEAFLACVAPFIVIDLIKMVIGMYVGGEIRKRLK